MSKIAERRRSCSERASALMLVPAGLLILMLLGSIAVDSAVAFMAQRELQNQAAAAANDAATLSLTPAELQLGEDATPDQVRSEEAVHHALDGMQVGRVTLRPGNITVATDAATKTVTVRVEADVPYVFATAVPGARHSAHVIVESAAQLRYRGQ